MIASNGDKVSIEAEKSRRIMECQNLPIAPRSSVQVKNLGKQIKWEYVFYIEYLGPILIIPAFFYMGYRNLYTWVQPIAAIMGVTHYVKREL